jgi:DNA-binding transcriptional MerR regulator
MSKAIWTIGELAATADVTPRTIRYYTAEGLLPPPEIRGKYALYSTDHLNRLHLIAQLKAAYLPLNEIRTRIARLTPDQVTQLLAEYEGMPQEPASTSAAGYIARVLQNRMAPPPEPLPKREQANSEQNRDLFDSEVAIAAPLTHYGNMPAPNPAMPRLQTGDREQGAPAGGSMLSRFVPQEPGSDMAAGSVTDRAEQREAWQRVTLAPGVELHLREPSAPGLHERIAELIQIARELFPDEKNS